MYPKTREIITKKRLEQVYPGVTLGFLTQEAEAFYAMGKAAVLPFEEQMTMDKRFDVASLTKVVCTTTVLLRLWEQGEICWDEPLRRYLPDFADGRVTLRHLLTHTSALRTWIPNRDQLDGAELRQAYLKMHAEADLGETVLYTDAGTILLGFMLEALYQQDVITVFQEQVLDPLGMGHSGFLPELTERKEIVPTEKTSTGVLRGVTHDPKARVLGPHAGNAGLFSDLGDLALFSRMYLQHGVSASGEQFLQEATIAELLQDQTPLKNGNRSLGWDLRPGKNTHPALFHTGYTGTFLLLDVAAQEAMIFLSNRLHPTDEREAYLKERDEIIACYQKERGVKS